MASRRSEGRPSRLSRQPIQTSGMNGEGLWGEGLTIVGLLKVPNSCCTCSCQDYLDSIIRTRGCYKLVAFAQSFDVGRVHDFEGLQRDGGRPHQIRL